MSKNKFVTNAGIVLLLTFSLFMISSVDAEATRYIKYNFTNGTIAADGTVHITDNPLTNVNLIGFVCTNENCSNVSSALDLSSGAYADKDNPPVLNSGDKDYAVLFFPTADKSVESYGYGVYIYKDGYIPWEQNPKYWGTKPGESPSNPTGPFTKTLKRKEGCSAPIMNFSAVNDLYENQPLVVNMDASLNADTYSAFSSAGPLNYTPPLLDKYYSANTSVTLVIRNSIGNVVETNTTYLLIPASGSKRIQFKWNATAIGTYNISVITGVPDGKCVQESVISQRQSKVVRVWQSLPKNACYTLLNNFDYSPVYPKTSELINFTYNKISNYANNFDPWEAGYDLSPTKTRITYYISNSTNDIIDSNVINLPANPNNYTPVLSSILWTPKTAGTYTALVSGISDDLRCLAVENPQDTATTTFTVTENIADIIPPSVSISSPTGGQIFTAPGITVSGTASDNAGLSKVEVKLGTGSWQAATGTTSWSKDVTLASGSNTIYARATDTSGNTGEVSVTVTNSILDTAAPILSDIQAGSITSSSAEITWATDEQANTTVFYGTSVDTPLNASSAGLATSHSISLESLSPSTLYYYNVSSCDSSGNCNKSEQFNFTTLAASVVDNNNNNNGGGGGGGGSSGGIGTTFLAANMLKNPNAVFTGLDVPDTIAIGSNLTVSGCAVNLDENSTMVLHLDNALKDSAKVSAPSTCFKLSGGTPAFGKHVVSVLLKDSKANFSKTVNVVENAKDISITDISVPDSVSVGNSETINVTVQVLKPANVDVNLSLDNIIIGTASAFVDGTYTFQFDYVFQESGNKTLSARAATKNWADTKTAQVQVLSLMVAGPTGGFLANALGNAWTYVLIVLLATSCIVYYLYRRGYLPVLALYVSRIKGEFSSLKTRFSSTGRKSDNEMKKNELELIKESVQKPETFEQKFYSNATGESERLDQ